MSDEKTFQEKVKVNTFLTRLYCLPCNKEGKKSELICHGQGVFYLYRCPSCGRGATSSVLYPLIEYSPAYEEELETFLGTNIEEEAKPNKTKRKKKNDQ